MRRQCKGTFAILFLSCRITATSPLGSGQAHTLHDDQIAKLKATDIIATKPELDLIQSLTGQDNGDMPNSSNQFGNVMLSPDLRQSTQPTDVVIRLALPSVGKSGAITKSERDQQRSKILAEQKEAIARLRETAPEMKVIAQIQMVANAIFVNVATSSLYEIAKDSSVTHVAPVGEYELDLSDTVPSIGADIVQANGFNGTGIKIAVLDSGIDYTHKNLGGEGTMQAYEKAYGYSSYDSANARRDGLFPTKKVVEGFDLVGETWPYSALNPDDDPIDYEGHGTFVADIIAGINGVAPGASLLAVKVCSSSSAGCNGIAMMQGVEYAVDQEADIINLSIGSTYGQPFDDDLSYALKSAHDDFGILVVAAAGNCGDRPYCISTPAAEPTALAVAQTSMPSRSFYIKIKDNDYSAIFFQWSQQLDEIVSGPLQYGDGQNGNTLGCEPFSPGTIEGKIILVDRGECYFSTKVQNIENGGGLVALIGNNVPGSPFSGGFGGGDYPTISAYMISQKDASEIRTEYSNAIADSISITCILDPTKQQMLPGDETVISTARGPDMSYNAIKPDIGAPGASVSAISGTGDRESPFGGTSGAAPMVAGSAALLMESCKKCTPLQIKALLMNNAYRHITSDTTGEAAEITRIGAGRIQVDKSLEASFWAYSPNDNQPSLGLGLVDVAEDITMSRTVRITNLIEEKQNLSIDPVFRLDGDARSGAIEIEVSKGGELVTDVTLEEGEELDLDVHFHLNAAYLPSNFMSSGFVGINPATLSANEIDGYLVLSSESTEVSLPWHVLVRKAARVNVERTTLASTFPNTVNITNDGAGIAQIDVFDLVTISDEKKQGSAGEKMPTPDIRAIGYRSTTSTFVESYCVSKFALQFAVNTWERQTHLLPVGFYFEFDIDQDGVYESKMLTRPADGSVIGIGDARFMTWAYNPAVGYSAKFFVGHATNTGNTVMTICGEQIGLTYEDAFKNVAIDVKAYALDLYHGGPGDEAESFTFTPFGERFTPSPIDGSDELRSVPELDLEPGKSRTLTIYDMKTQNILNSESYGVMIISNGYRGEGTTGAATEDTEYQLLLVPGIEGPKSLGSSGNVTVTGDASEESLNKPMRHGGRYLRGPTK